MNEVVVQNNGEKQTKNREKSRIKRSAGESLKLREGQEDGEGREREVKNILRMETLFLYLTVFMLLSFHSSSIFPHIFTKHLSEVILLLMLGFKEETELL